MKVLDQGSGSQLVLASKPRQHLLACAVVIASQVQNQDLCPMTSSTKVLAPAAGVRVSPLCLGTMNFGDAWQSTMGKCDKDNTFAILDYYFEQGGNFIDT